MMLRKLLYTVAVLIALIVIAVAVLPYFIGLQAESSFKHQVATFNASNPGLVLHVDAYRRGFYSSVADVALSGVMRNENRAFGLIFGTGAAARFHIRINHGPIPFAAFGTGHWNFTPVLYTAEFRGNNLPALSLLGAFNPDFYLVQYFDGTATTHIRVPPGRFGLGVAGATWRGGRATIHRNAAGDRLHYNGRIEPVNFQFMLHETGQAYSGILQAIRFSGARHKAANGFWVGRGASDFAGLVVKSGGSEVAHLAGAHSENQVGESANGRWLNAALHLVQTGGTIGGWKFSRLTFEGSLAKLDAAPLRRGLDALRARAVRIGGKATPTQTRTVMENALAPALTSATTGKLAATLSAPSGTASFNVHIEFTAPPGGSSAVASPSLGAQSVGQGSLSFDRSLVDDFAHAVLAPGLPLLLDQGLRALVAEGYLMQTPGGNYRALIGYRAGALTINGRTVNKGN